MRVITRDQVKTQLGIEDTSLDTQIDAKLPIIDAKVKQVCNYHYNLEVTLILTGGSDLAYISSHQNVNNDYEIEDIQEYIMAGDELEGTGLTTGTYIYDVYPNDLKVKLSAVATATGTESAYIGMNKGYHDVIAKGVQFLITGTSQSLPQNRVKSKSLPPLSVTYTDTKIDPKTGMPNWFIEALPKYQGGH
jgi:hypothetical protein